MNRFRSWFRHVHPHDGIVLAVVSTCLVNEALSLAANAIPRDNWVINHPVTNFFIQLAGTLHQLNVALLFMGVMVLAVYRAWAFHPLYRPDYRNWLQSTPWTAESPLPNGPIHLTLQDGLLVLGAMLVSWSLHPEYPASHIILTFLLIYESVLAASLALLKLRRHAYTAAFGLGLIVALWSRGMAAWALLVAAVVYVDLQFGLRRALAQLETWGETLFDTVLDQLTNRPEDRNQSGQALGWPLALLRPDPEFTEIPAVDGLLLSLLAGWWGNSLFLLVEESSAFPMVLATFVLLTAICGRLGIYLGGFAPPISLPGRAATGRWIIPGYDRVFVTPLASIAILTLFGIAQHRYDLHPRMTTACMIAATLAPLLIGGPGLRRWQLTGQYRLTPVLSNAKATGQVRLP